MNQVSNDHLFVAGLCFLIGSSGTKEESFLSRNSSAFFFCVVVVGISRNGIGGHRA